MKAEQLSFAAPDIYTELRMEREQKKAKRRWARHGKPTGRSGRMKTLDEVIKNLGDGTEHLSAILVSKETWGDALSYLNEYKELSKMWNDRLDKENSNPPLTWNELKDMIGKPVWVEVLDDNGDHYKWRGDGWYIVKDFTQGYYGSYCHLEPSWRTWTESTYGDLWQAYRKER